MKFIAVRTTDKGCHKEYVNVDTITVKSVKVKSYVNDLYIIVFYDDKENEYRYDLPAVGYIDTLIAMDNFVARLEGR